MQSQTRFVNFHTDEKETNNPITSYLVHSRTKPIKLALKCRADIPQQGIGCDVCLEIPLRTTKCEVYSQGAWDAFWKSKSWHTDSVMHETFCMPPLPWFKEPMRFRMGPVMDWLNEREKMDQLERDFMSHAPLNQRNLRKHSNQTIFPRFLHVFNVPSEIPMGEKLSVTTMINPHDDALLHSIYRRHYRNQ